MTTEQLNLLTLPLHGSRLIEAAAGTGKTYTLAMLYLRLMLGLGGESAYSRPLNVQEILVVTFTKATAKELRGRIRNNIRQLRMACLEGNSADPLMAALIAQLRDLRWAASHLLAAERQIDEAAIYTIHGFCQHILNYNTVESGMLFNQTLLENESSLNQQFIADFWRRHCYPLPIDVARIVLQYWEGPEKLLEELLPYLQGEPPMILNPPDITESILARHERIIASINDLKRQWRAASSTLKTILYEYKLDRRVYSNKNILTWLAKTDRWANENTINYQVPDELMRFTSSVLKEKTIGNEPPQHELFVKIEAFYQQRLSLRELIFSMALVEMRQDLEKEKKSKAEMGFNDLLSSLEKALVNSGENLSESVRIRYPVVMIDEFQDTDPQQYRIFRRIYSGQSDCGLILIGDPKQAIYAFRNADIFTYLLARSEVNCHYTLDTNWRSTPGMINAVNHIFQSLPEPFIFSDIPFVPAIAAEGNVNFRLVVNNQPQSAMHIWLQPGAGVGVREYQKCMARQCATTIRDWLYAAQEGKAWLEKHQGRQTLQASDITVLVHNRKEAALVRDALATLMIPSVYLSNKDSVFKTIEARELQWILQAVLMPEQDITLRRALATSLLSFNAATINALNNDDQRWEQLIEEFTCYRQRWQKNGIQPMLRQIMKNYRIAESLLSSQGGQRRLTDVLHLEELLQEASTQLDNEFALIRWLEIQVQSPNPQINNQQVRLESDHHLVQIITVHKSKGLEFPLVFLPFAANFHTQKRPLFHDRITYSAWLDLNAAPESLRLAEEERLSEDLRLLYVALTRSIYHCSIGIAPLCCSNRKKNGASNLHLSALGYLIQQGLDSYAYDLREKLAALASRSSGDIVLYEDLLATPAKTIMPIPARTPTLSVRKCPSLPRDTWRITSYSDLQKHDSSEVIELQLWLDGDAARDCKSKEILPLTQHNFPRGTSTGRFLHSLLETLNFNKSLDPQSLNKKLTQQGIDTVWLPIITQWIENILAMPLDNRSISLANIAPDSRHTELSFYLLIHSLVQARDIDILCKRYDPLSARCPSLDFPQFTGILKGFIDLVFRWQGRYYILDYKSNWLGENDSAYTLSAMEQAIITHRYDLQYQLYTLALHRFLRHRIIDYNYQRDFGEVYYVFLRGINSSMPRNGIFHCRPDIDLIDGLDKLFTG
ncbi:exodeoxyribonuclease V subunit beta [Sodalis endosymbiont of Henestaris halophilus]|uniref:exodeoxyribonuclease V subunit beta n=1 Tax=Sodalis endosymbiont of Henestaris halophilus TaxID=1929246 RepID=UPI000BC02E21|nr:exodeoxyribonuclease V subunit beta [Sodalis endosymbiont of Henestaris halophilus]SNC58299.1 RecBCD enzyme subunit RecB [Sodalis endosymbiont of Henestaris halophilus]